MIAEETRKPWGKEILWAKTSSYAGKIIKIRRGRRLSLQKHNKKKESIFVLRGPLILRVGDEHSRLMDGEAFDIHPGTVHRFSALDKDVVLVEVSTPQLRDVVRIEDDYGRR